MLDRGSNYVFPDIEYDDFPSGMDFTGLFNPVAQLDNSRMANITTPQPATTSGSYGVSPIAGPEAYLQFNLKKTAKQPQVNQLLMLVDLLRRNQSVSPTG